MLAYLFSHQPLRQNDGRDAGYIGAMAGTSQDIKGYGLFLVILSYPAYLHMKGAAVGAEYIK